jgi:hypothetical protein
MHRRVFIVFLLFLLARAWADTEPPAVENNDERQPQTTSDQESEAKGIIPEGGIAVSTQPITPIALLPDRNLYDQALEELTVAQDLMTKGKAEAASDVSLQAYDDLVSVSLRHRDKKKRKKLREDRQQAATIYITESILYIESYVERNGGGYRAVEEGRARLGDLRDVTINYPELNKRVSKELERYSVVPSSPTH